MKSRSLSLFAIFIALSAAGASIKIPALIGSVAFDVLPALLAAGIIGGAAGAAAGGMGHLLSAMIAGMPLGPYHFLIAVEMALLIFLFALIYKTGKRRAAGVFLIMGNSFAAPLPFLFLMGKSFYLSIVPSLFAGSVLNVVLALLILPRIAKVLEHSPRFSSRA